MSEYLHAALREGVLRGLQVHLDSPVPGVRERGMTAGQCLMNSLHSLPSQQLLHFDLPDTEDTQAILQLARWILINAPPALCVLLYSQTSG